MARTRLWCLRHGESENVTGATAGVMPAAPLTERGEQQAAAVAHALGGEHIRRVYSSTAVRAFRTAQTVAARAGVGVVAFPGLAEVSVGRYEGSRDPRVRHRTAAVLRSWVVEGRLSERVGDGASGQEVLDRMAATLERAADAHVGETAALVGHVGSLTVALARLCGLGPSVWGAPLPYAEPFLVERGRGGWRCLEWPR
ncbi:histidine phosphatase family protein [Promicromonospora sp. NPDC050880]|uniref:histidine phosphatase family protein n=1 Tax=Promicromonospora sp. NPDC050880 TaxID=3364406 RepID=UPI0037A68195